MVGKAVGLTDGFPVGKSVGCFVTGADVGLEVVGDWVGLEVGIDGAKVRQ